jgi:hypothetical protein
VTAAVALRAALPRVEALSSGEKVLLGEWLERITAGPATGRDTTPVRARHRPDAASSAAPAPAPG